MRMDICEILLENSAIDSENFYFGYRFESDLSKHFLFLLVHQIQIKNDYSRSELKVPDLTGSAILSNMRMLLVSVGTIYYICTATAQWN